MVVLRRAVLACAAVLVLVPLPAVGGAVTTSHASAAARVQPWLQEQIVVAAPDAAVRVYVHADTGARAGAAARAAGLTVVETFEKVGVTVADGPPAAVRRVAQQRHVTYVEGDPPARIHLDKAHLATRNSEAQATLRDRSGAPLAGTGISVAVIDTGVDGTHPFFRLPDGRSKVVANHKTACHNIGYLLLQPSPNRSDACWAPVLTNDSDTGSAGGHGTHVAGIVAGVPMQVRPQLGSSKILLSGAAPGASIVALSVGATASMYGGNTGLNWVLNHHAAPCGPGVSRAACPPIRVTNNSYGPAGGSTYNPDGVTEKLQQALVREGVVTVWAAGNDGGDGSGANAAGRPQRTNGPGNDPTAGILMVASYNHGRDGTRDGQLSGFSSRGTKGAPETYPDLSAPGDYILSSCRPWMPLCIGFPYDGPGAADTGAFTYLGGTSMAAPYVAGVVAEMLQVDPSLTPAQVEVALEDSAHRFGGDYEDDPANPGRPTSYDKGHGLVDVAATVQRVLDGRIAAPVVRVRPPYVPFRTRPGVLSCSIAFTDARDDATDPVTKQNRASMDLVAGRLGWDGEALTVTFVVNDVNAPRGSASTGEQFQWTLIAGDGAPFDVVTTTGVLRSTYLSRGSTTVTASGLVVDRPGTGADEVRVTFTDDQLAALPGADPKLAKGLVLQTREVSGYQMHTFVRVKGESVEVGTCPYVVGAADRLG